MAKYEYAGETFQVDSADECEIKVTDGTNTISITLNAGGPSVYKVSTVKGGWWWHHDTVESSINQACQELVKARSAVNPSDACKEMSEFVEKLKSGS